MDRVDGNVAEREILVEILLGADISSSELDAHLDIQDAALADGGEVNIGVEDGDIGVGLDRAADDGSGFGRPQPDRASALAVELQRDLFQIQNNVGGIFHHAGDRTELVGDALNAHGGDGRSFDRTEKGAAQRVADSGAEASFKGLGREFPVGIAQRIAIGGQPFWLLKSFPHRVVLPG